MNIEKFDKIVNNFYDSSDYLQKNDDVFEFIKNLNNDEYRFLKMFYKSMRSHILFLGLESELENIILFNCFLIFIQLCRVPNIESVKDGEFIFELGFNNLEKQINEYISKNNYDSNEIKTKLKSLFDNNGRLIRSHLPIWDKYLWVIFNLYTKKRM